MSLTIKHLEQLQEILQEKHLDYQLELEDGKIIVMGPSDVYSSEIRYLLELVADELGCSSPSRACF